MVEVSILNLDSIDEYVELTRDEFDSIYKEHTNEHKISKQLLDEFAKDIYRISQRQYRSRSEAYCLGNIKSDLEIDVDNVENVHQRQIETLLNNQKYVKLGLEDDQRSILRNVALAVFDWVYEQAERNENLGNNY